jgi:putative transposase
MAFCVTRVYRIGTAAKLPNRLGIIAIVVQKVGWASPTSFHLTHQSVSIVPQYRRARIPGSIIFITCVTYQRQPLFQDPRNIQRLRDALAQTKMERPFNILAAVILPNHLHFLWKLPENDCNYSARVGRMKVLFTRAFNTQATISNILSISRQKHREQGVWQRRFWERSLCDQKEINHYLNYIHYNPVKHGLVSCPHAWPYSSFSRYVDQGIYSANWACQCRGYLEEIPDFSDISDLTGE